MATKVKDTANRIRRITVKTVCGKIDFDEVFKNKDKLIPLMRVYGVATRLKPGSGDYGPYVRFLGNFRALNVKTGEMFSAPVCLLPKFLEDELAGMMGTGEAAKPAEFALEVSVKFDKDAATKYVYHADNLVETAVSDQMLSLEQRIREDNPRALPAPKKDEAK